MGVRVLALSLSGPNTGLCQSCGEVSVDRMQYRAWPGAQDMLVPFPGLSLGYLATQASLWAQLAGAASQF